MTNENKDETADEHAEEKAASNSPDDAEQSPASSALELRQEQDRRMIIFASVLFLLLVAPLFLPIEGSRSVWHATRYHSTDRVIWVGLFGWPVCLGALGLVRGLKREVPGKVLIGVGTILTSVQTLASAALLYMILGSESSASRSPHVWLGAAALLVAMVTIVRSFFRTGWQRFQDIMAAFSLLVVMVMLAFVGTEPYAIEQVAVGGWLFVFASAALLPFAIVTLASRKT